MIRIIRLIFNVILWGSVISCQSSGKKNEQNQTVDKRETCLSNPVHSYQIFIPASEIQAKELPLLVAIDSHGSGQNAVNHLKEAVSTYPAILVASNLIQNNDPNFIHELDELIADVKNRYQVGERIYLTGFSGGARMALSYAANHQANGVIACGAFASQQQLAAIKCPVTGILGMDDFNFPEVARYILQPETIPDHVQIELNLAAHEWPSSKQLCEAFGWFQLSPGSSNSKETKKYADARKHQIDSLTASGELLQAACIARNMSQAEEFEKAGSFHSMNQNLTEKPTYKKQLSELTGSLQFEMKVRKAYSDALLEKDEEWWKNEISVLNNKIETESNTIRKMAYKRLKGFLGIICYSYSRQFANQKDIPHLTQILMVYRLAEPDNEDMKHFSEVLADLNGQ